ncbi:MAG: hypothetical protein AAB074_14430 [Planctomycetota bacterium]
MFRNRLVVMGTFMLSAAVLTSCQSSGETTTRESVNCPSCKTAVTTTPLKGLSFSKHMCPSCKSTTGVVGESFDPVHVCNKCELIVELCDLCRKEEGK